MKANDIPELPILEFLSKAKHWCNRFPTELGGEPNPESIFHAIPAGTPPKVGLAKMRALIKKKLVDGCACGCRGDFVITDLGREVLKSQASECSKGCGHGPAPAQKSGNPAVDS